MNMKTYTIGRQLDNTIVYDEQTNGRFRLVSAHHAVIKVSPWDAYTIRDSSTNGTTVNGERIERDVDVRIRRGDNVVFATVAELNWDEIRRPHGLLYLALGTIVAIVALVMALGGRPSASPSPGTGAPATVAAPHNDDKADEREGASDKTVDDDTRDTEETDEADEEKATASGNFLTRYLRGIKEKSDKPKTTSRTNGKSKSTSTSNAKPQSTANGINDVRPERNTSRQNTGTVVPNSQATVPETESAGSTPEETKAKGEESKKDKARYM